MRSLGGFVLLAGIGFGLFVYLPAPVSSDTSLEQARRLAAARVAQARVEVASTTKAVRSFAPDVSLASIAHTKAQSTAPTGWPAVTVAAVNAQGQPALAPNTPDGRYKLVLDIQRQLKRVGCYYGKLNGSWGAASKYAMKDFMDRVNAALPFEQPEYVHLTLLQSQNGRTCGECPAGQTALGGRCVPQANYAQTQQPAQPPATWPTATTTTATPTTTATAPEPLPWQGSASPQPLFKPVASSVISSEPLPGRMAIGAPRDLPPVDASNAEITDAYGVAVPAGVAASTAALAPGAPAATPQKSRPSRSARRRDGPGTPRYNLMLSLGGVY